MDERRTGDAAVTGVARGSLGTGTALDETQEWVIPAELQARSEPELASAAAAEPPAAPVPDPAPVGAVEPRPVGAQPTRRRTSPRGALGSPRTAGIAAAVLLALIGVTAVVTSVDRTDPAAPAAEQPSTAPTNAAPVEAAGPKDKDKGGGKGNGHGNGNGRDN